ncbi:hypothetical protein Emed_001121 [Eimeria media]
MIVLGTTTNCVTSCVWRELGQRNPGPTSGCALPSGASKVRAWCAKLTVMSRERFEPQKDRGRDARDDDEARESAEKPNAHFEGDPAEHIHVALLDAGDSLPDILDEGAKGNGSGVVAHKRLCLALGGVEDYRRPWIRLVVEWVPSTPESAELRRNRDCRVRYPTELARVPGARAAVFPGPSAFGVFQDYDPPPCDWVASPR